MGNGYRQEVFNVVLAQILQKHGVISAPERIIKARPDMRRRMPDVMVYFRGLRLVIEGEVEDTPKAEERALESARRRVEEGLAHIGVAVVYPLFLRRLDKFAQLKSELENSQLRIAVVNESGETGFTSGNVERLAEMLSQSFDQLVREDVVSQAVAILDAAVERAAPALSSSPGFAEEAAKILGIRALPKKRSAEDEEGE